MEFGSRIYLDFARPDRTLVEAFREIPVANIDDCMGRIAAISEKIRPLGRTPLLGTAFTVKVPEGDNLMFHKAMDLAKPGDVIMIDAGGDTKRAIFGELMAHYCMLRGVAGIVVDGSVRDASELESMDIAVYARGVTPNGPYKNGPGEINVPVTVGGRVVYPGDIVVGDGDGVVVIRPADALAVLKSVDAVQKKEAEIMACQLRDRTYPRPWVDEKIAALGYCPESYWNEEF